MSHTLLETVKRVARNIGMDPAITAFSDTDETQLLVDYINQGVEELRDALPWVPTLDKNGSLSLSNATRLYSVPSDALATEIYTWSFDNDTEANASLEPATLEWVKTTYADYDTRTGKPGWFYLEDGQLGFYPIPDGVYTVKYLYQEQTSRMTSTSATFPYPDKWLKWIEHYATLQYQLNKGMGDPEVTLLQMKQCFAKIYAEVWQMRPQYLL